MLRVTKLKLISIRASAERQVLVIFALHRSTILAGHLWFMEFMITFQRYFFWEKIFRGVVPPGPPSKTANSSSLLLIKFFTNKIK